ncbi:MAG: hypothetical protein JW849_07535 [Phycisphaerae bacterium]|nr:hypothetical protein [Phycisphaerae bacterium]
MKNHVPNRWPRRGLLVVLTAAAVGVSAMLAMQAGAQTHPRPVAGQPGELFVTAGRISGETYGLYLVDYTNRTISVYQVTPRAKKDKLRLMAARTYAYDVRLDDYNTTPSPREIQRLVEQHRRLEAK